MESKFKFWCLPIGEMADEINYPDKGINETLANSNAIIPLQFTGIKDKNGKEVFVGDIIQFSNREVWFRNNLFLESPEKRKEILEDVKKYPYERREVCFPESYEWLLSDEIQEYWEVIGNVYENPELKDVLQKDGE